MTYSIFFDGNHNILLFFHSLLFFLLQHGSSRKLEPFFVSNTIRRRLSVLKYRPTESKPELHHIIMRIHNIEGTVFWLHHGLFR